MDFGIVENNKGNYDLVDLVTKEVIKCNESFNYAQCLNDRLNAGDYKLLKKLKNKYRS
ncbi:hypothetical protein [Thomasclavelia cocleata]|uniref:hypothetical protein n=1 Tax=Thomasclavelia cocleata TaxID=69824 RepID=UPI002493FD52|nr:hypothetical protein [Thomasclavelia cocleata]